MGQRKSAQDGMADMAGGIFLAIFLLLWAAIAGLFSLIVKSSKKSPEKQLSNWETLPVWGAEIVGISCPVCSQLNDYDVNVCFQCGSEINQIHQSNKWLSRNAETISIAFAVTAFLLFILLLFAIL
jgi:hypothetical protein